MSSILKSVVVPIRNTADSILAPLGIRDPKLQGLIVMLATYGGFTYFKPNWAFNGSSPRPFKLTSYNDPNATWFNPLVISSVAGILVALM